MLVVWRDTYQNSYRLFYWYNNAFAHSPAVVYNSINFTDANSINPALSTKKSGSDVNFHFGYQQGDTEIKYALIRFENDDPIYLNQKTISSQSPYSKNYKPSLIVLNINGTESVRFAWIGERDIYADPNKTNALLRPSVEKRVIFRALSNTTLSAFWYFGYGVSSTSINSTDDMNYIIGWSLGSGLQNQYVRNTTLSQVKTFKKNTVVLTGSDLQVVNGANFSSQYASVYNSATLPYVFSTSDAVSVLGKETSVDMISNGREGIVTKDSAHIYFSFGDIQVDNTMIDFVPIEDTVVFNDRYLLNSYLISMPFQLQNNSLFSYSVQYGCSDSASASTMLSQNDSVIFKIQLVDDVTGEILGVYDEVAFTNQNPISYDNIYYNVDVNGIGNRVVRLRLLLNNNFNALYNLATKYAIDDQLFKKNPMRIYFNGQDIVNNYDLYQNYPNPFNPNTTIRYQLPEPGLVTIKIYDLLGAEVTTLVNEEKTPGTYEVSYSASSLSSGVYIFKIQAGAFVNSKKMLLIK